MNKRRRITFDIVREIGASLLALKGIPPTVHRLKGDGDNYSCTAVNREVELNSWSERNPLRSHRPWHIVQLVPAALRSFLISVMVTPPWSSATSRALASAAAGDADLPAITYWSLARSNLPSSK